MWPQFKIHRYCVWIARISAWSKDEDWYENFLKEKDKFLKTLALVPKAVEELLHVKKKVTIATFWSASSAEYFYVAATYKDCSEIIEA